MGGLKQHILSYPTPQCTSTNFDFRSFSYAILSVPRRDTQGLGPDGGLRGTISRTHEHPHPTPDDSVTRNNINVDYSDNEMSVKTPERTSK